MFKEKEDDNTIQILNKLKEDWEKRQSSSRQSSDGNLQEPAESPLESLPNALKAQLVSIFQRPSFQDVLVGLLNDIVKPQVSAYKHAKLTDQGTVRIRPRGDKHDFQEINPPQETVSILLWVSTQIEKNTIQSSFHLLLPTLLILLDSAHAAVRTQATTILSNILNRVDEAFLAKTGITEVFWQAISPNLSALPPITDLNESVALLSVTYPTLITLSRLWYTERVKRIFLLDKVVRDGFIHAMLFSADKLKVVAVEFQSLNLLIEEMGINFVKHLKHVIPIISSILANPIGGNHPPQLLSALNTLELIITTCKPRISHHHAEILRGTITCWRYLRNQDTEDIMPVREKLKEVIRALVEVSPEAEVDMKSVTAIDDYFAELA